MVSLVPGFTTILLYHLFSARPRVIKRQNAYQTATAAISFVRVKLKKTRKGDRDGKTDQGST